MKMANNTYTDNKINASVAINDIPKALVNDWYVTGLTDSEGNFSINYNKNTNKVTFSYKITQKVHSISVLHDLKAFFNCGNVVIDNKDSKGYKFQVSSLDSIINIIIPHFENLQGSKRLDYLTWKNSIIDYRKSQNIDSVLECKDNINSKRLFDERWHYFNKVNINLDPEWVRGFVDGEGSFQINIGNYNNRGKPLLRVAATFEIAQNSHEIKLLEAIKLFFNPFRAEQWLFKT